MPGRLERQLHLLERCLARGGLRFGEAERELAPISSATVARLLRELCAAEVLVHDDDGVYRAGPRPLTWSQQALVSPAQRRVVDRLGRELACTATLWRLHGRGLRCVYRHLDEHSPALSPVGNLRRAELPVVGGGLVMSPEQLDDRALLEGQAARTPGNPAWPMLRRIVRGCRDHGVSDDHAAFWTGSRRIGVRAGPAPLVGIALAAGRIRSKAERDAVIARLHRAAADLGRAPST